MGYYLHAYIGLHKDVSILSDRFKKARRIELSQGISLIPLTEELFDEINELTVSDSIDKFTYLTENIEKQVLRIIDERRLAYLEAEYFGGAGGQMAIIWEDRKCFQLLKYGDDRINQALRIFGVIAAKGEDEFSTLGLGRYRNTNDWFENQD